MRRQSAEYKDFEGKLSPRPKMGGPKLRGEHVSSDFNGGQERDSGKKSYKGEAYMNDVDEPRFQKIDHKRMAPEAQLGMMVDCSDYKREASGQAYGQSGEDGCLRDDRRIRDQFRPAYSDDTGY